MILLYYIFIFLSILMTLASHPIFMLTIIISQTLNICSILWILTKSSWFSLILFLIFLGGLMILFVYIVSLASNEIFDLKLFENKILMTLFLLIFMSLPLKTFFTKMEKNFDSLILNKILIIFSNNMILPTTLIMTYLLLVLIIAVKISSKMEGPIRNFT
uniref:NADH-ubiquinone oxidoreductase chain 6 n=1 Tax=Homidia socia TaxID=301514 RepID=A0A6G6A4M9_9HEXA|nr:NADH dehydrogenase subunit 6 [Homidia socia]